MRRFYLPIRAWRARIKGVWYGRPAHGIFVSQATLNPLLACA